MLLSSMVCAFNASADTDVTGTWTFVFTKDDSSLFATEIIQLTQVGTDVVGLGTITTAPFRVVLGGTNIADQVDFATVLDGNIVPTFFQGTIETPERMSGIWQDNAANTGLWNGTKGGPLVTPSTKLVSPPIVQVEQKKVTINFIPFSGVGPIKARSAITARAKGPKLTFRYYAEVDRKIDGTGKIIKLERKKIVSKRNQVTLNSLKPGVYTARYRVEFTQKGSDEIVSKTGFSPRVTFAVQ